jgi:molybdopterin converting factor small subunit
MTGSGTTSRRATAAPGRARLLLFSTARTAVGQGALDWPVPPDGTSIRELLHELAEVHPAVGPVLAHSRIFHDGLPVFRLDERVRAGDEVAVHPPYGGG